jgi:chaperonin GroES
MQPKLAAAMKRLLTPLGEYIPAQWSGKNTSGILPIGDRVLVLPDKAPDESAGGIKFTEAQQDRDGLAAETGILVALGEAAWKWNSDRTRPFDGTRPEIGQRVWFERYAGSVQYGKDGVAYRLMDDKCVGAVAVAED